MLKLQQKFQDRQNGPLDTAIWWIEYFIRNPNAEHLNPQSRDLSFFVANSLDVFCIVFIICIVFVINCWILVKNFKIMISSSKKKDQKGKDMNKKKSKKS